MTNKLDNLRHLPDRMTGYSVVDCINGINIYDLTAIGLILNPNSKIVNAITSMAYRNNGNCPCTNDSNVLQCPCSNCIEKSKCCCKLYIPSDHTK